MGKIYNSLLKEIMTAMKAGEKDKAFALKNLKAKLIEYKTSVEGSKVVNANNGEIPDINEIAVIKKYVKELQSDIETYELVKPDAGKHLAKAARIEKSYLEIYLPPEASASDINNVIAKYVDENGDFEQKEMGLVVKYVKSHLDNADGGLIAKQIKAYLSGGFNN